MGTDYTVHVGPFIKASFSIIDKPQKVFGCKNCKSVTKMAKKFCDECGSKLEDYEVMKKSESIEYWEVAEKIKEVLSVIVDDDDAAADKFHLWVPNIPYGSREFSFNPTQEYGIVEIVKEEDIKGEIEQFEKKFGRAIDILKKEYDKVEIEWGIVNNIS